MKDDKTTLFVKKCLKIFHIKLSDKNENLFIQIFKFIIVGGIATVIDWLVYYVLYKFLNINPLLGNILAFSVSVIYNYIASVKWVFNVNESKSKKRMFVEFIVLSVIGLLLTELLLWIGINKLGMHAMTTKIIATAIVMVFNFITRKIFLE